MKINASPSAKLPQAADKSTVSVSKGSSRAALDQAWTEFQREWLSSTKQMHSLVKAVPQGSRRLVQLQLLSQQLHLRSLVAAKAGEAVSGSIRRIQQMGSS
ncbi:MAG: hypothetical protein KDD66_07060 [Bdellovibrionales bacterium]|nr:hypothetical protein [Bdellovibrionales bacterium]